MRLIAPIISIVFALALTGAIWLFSNEHEKNREQANQIAKLKTDIADKSVQQSFELKRKCASEADRFYKQWNDAPSSAYDFYESHYSPTRQACFILIHYGDPTNTGLLLFDAVERRQYAEFTSSGKVGLLGCSLTPADGEKKDCKSRAELNAFVASYMESASDLPF